MTIRRPVIFALAVSFGTVAFVALMYFVVIPAFFIGNIPFD